MNAEAAPRRTRGRRPMLEATVAVVCLVSLAASDVRPSETRIFASGPVEIRVAQSADMSRVEMRGAFGARARVRVEGGPLVVSLPRGARPALARLRVDPPRGVTAVE